MKKIISFAAILILLVNLAACSTGAGTTEKADGKAVSYGTAGATSSGDGKPSISVYYMMYDEFVSNAITEFKSKYPGVNITQKYYYLNSSDDFTKALSTEILTGGGPDILVCRPSSNIDSLSKMLSSGAFADLNDFINRDKEFKLDNYSKNVLDAGIIDGKRVFMPIYYSRQFFYTTESVLKKNNIKISDDCSVKELSNIVDEFIKNKAKKCKYLFNDEFDFKYLMNFYGTEFLDYSNRKANFDSEEFKDLLRLYKKMQPLIASQEVVINNGYFTVKLLNNDIAALIMDNIGNVSKLYNENCFIKNEMNEELKLIKIAGSDKTEKLKPVIRNVAAISNNCKNKEYAFDFIKILLSDEIQREDYNEGNSGSSKPIINTSFNPVSLSAFKKELDKYTVNCKKGITGMSMSYDINKISATISAESIPITDALVKRITDINNNMAKPEILDKSVSDIIDEALKDYLAGKKDENQTAQLINNKVELFLNE